MKLKLHWLILACLISFVPARSAQEAGTSVLYDFIRTRPPYDEPQLSPQQVSKVLNAALGAGWRRRADSISISQIVTGSFTAANVQEVAYVIRGSGATNAQTRIDMGNDARLVVFSGSRVVANAPFYGIGVLKTSDLNRDGVDELLLYAGATGTGETVTSAEMVEVKGKRLRVIKDFGTVESISGCYGGDEDSGGRHVTSIIRYAPAKVGAFPRFRVEFYQCACADESEVVDPQKCRFVQADKMPDE
ncbi:MAG: hypothetical protein ACJ74Q_15010 [Pyrinomonadaceae bacterium]